MRSTWSKACAATDEQHHTDEAERRKQVMSTGGLSRARLSRMHEVMAGYVERGEVPGLVTLVSMRGMGPPSPSTMPAPDEWMRRLGRLPLMHQPGEQWMYNTGSDVLGVLIARASGQPLETFLRERIFEPLGMKDTSFSVPAASLDRLATSYWPDPTSGKLTVYDESIGSQWSRPPAFPSGAGDLVPTIADYL